MEADKKLRILSTLNKHIDSAEGIPPTSVNNIPSLVFSLTCFFNQDDMNQLVTDTVEKLSAIYRNEFFYSYFDNSWYDDTKAWPS